VQFLLTTTEDGSEPDAAMYAELGRYLDELTRAGVLVATGGLDEGTRITTSGGEFTVTDGPFTETKEAIVSFAVVEVASREEAIEVARRFQAIFGAGRSTMYQVFGPAST
jgi:hypothetical protein